MNQIMKIQKEINELQWLKRLAPLITWKLVERLEGVRKVSKKIKIKERIKEIKKF